MTVVDFIKSIFLKKKNQFEAQYIPAELDYKKNRQHGINVRNAWRYSDEIANMMQYHVLNKMKEIELKRKVREGKKVRVCFYLTTISKFTSNNIYKIMENNDLYEPFIAFGSEYENEFKKDMENDIENDVVWNKHLEEYNILKEKGYNVYSLYDKNRNFIPIENFKPDIVFMSLPYLEYLTRTHLSNTFMNVNYLVCYNSYGCNISNSYIYHYNNRRINTVWKNFVYNRYDYLEFMKYSRDFGINTVLTGFPRLDDYAKPIEQCKIPDKINNGKPIVIYAPHWTIVHNWEPNDLGTFDLYNEYFLNLVKKYPNINFVFKPHPALSCNLNENKIMSYEEFNNYVKEWESLPNGYCEMGGEYIDLFRKSSLMITDSGSFILEYLPSDNPCMYLVKPSRNQETYMDGFALAARRTLEKYYLCHNLEEIEKNFKMIMEDKIDSMRGERIRLKDDIFINIGSASQKIVDYLNDLLTESDEVKL